MLSAHHTWTAWLVLSIQLFTLTSAGWSPWTQFTSCSRSCGGGVKFRERMCVVDRLDRDVCKGKRRTYKLCNTQTCENGGDFREAQCQEHNNKDLNGETYSWKPYYGHGETCELLCYAEGEDFYHKMADKVLDGTLCHDKKHRICVQGHCKNVGCDKKIGSHKKTDACGVCAGDNSSCTLDQRVVQGVFDVNPLPPDYTSIVEIPAGSADIVITELAENKNMLVFWDSFGSNISIDERSRKQLTSAQLAGTRFIYTAADGANTHGELLAPGPTTSVVTAYMVNTGWDNPGVSYSYLSPSSDTKNTTHTLPYLTNSAINGSKSNPSSAISKPSNIQVSTSHVASIPSIGQANVHVVDTHSRPDRLREFTGNTDDQSGHTRQIVYANGVQIFKGDNSVDNSIEQPVNLDLDEDTNRGENERNNLDAREQRENSERNLGSRVVELGVTDSGLNNVDALYDHTRFLWSYGQWTPCAPECGDGFQRRIVSCVDREKREVVGDFNCSAEERPRNARRCNNGACNPDQENTNVVWQASEWGACSQSCDLGEQVKEVYCQAILADNTTRLVDDELCLKQYRSKPQYRRSCNDGVPCVNNDRPVWTSVSWSQCSVTCGRGIETRRVSCVTQTSRRELRDSACQRIYRPDDSRGCELAPCIEQSRWRTSSWGQCSVTCGRGIEYRSVYCRSEDTQQTVPDTLCDRDIRPDDRRQCEVAPCRSEIPVWRASSWGQCSTSCGRGIQYRSVYCQSQDSREELRESSCDRDQRPDDRRQCEVAACRSEIPVWRASSWGQCSTSCGRGIQYRSVYCQSQDSREELRESSCDRDLRPDDRRQCEVAPCRSEIPVWRASSWGQCSTSCGRGIQYRSVYCQSQDSREELRESSCDRNQRPDDSRQCDLAPCRSEKPVWRASSWGQCSTSCGRGIQYRSVYCQSQDSREELRESSCDSDLRPDDRRQCETVPCRSEIPVWRASSWGQCSTSCGRGLQYRSVYCQSQDSREEMRESSCDRDQRPDDRRQCEVAPCRSEKPVWRASSWGQCSTSCGRGIQYRSVYCQSQDSREELRESSCDRDIRPDDRRQCETVPCRSEIPVWRASSWGQCSTSCGRGIQYRSVYCQSQDSREELRESSCDRDLRPDDRRQCETVPCRSEIPVWRASSWGQCSTSCGRGLQYRSVYCQSQDSREEMRESSCDRNQRPDDSRQCDVASCTETSVWKASPWGQCSTSCGDGVQYRRVYCRTRDTRQKLPDTTCDRDLRPVESRQCKLRPCSAMWVYSPWSQCSVTCGVGVKQRRVTCQSETGQAFNDTTCDRSVRPGVSKRCQMIPCKKRVVDCSTSRHGCCPDGITRARGRNFAGCPPSQIRRPAAYRIGGTATLPCAQLSRDELGRTFLVEWERLNAGQPIIVKYSNAEAQVYRGDFQDRVRIIYNTSLEIRPLRRTDAGVYTCRLKTSLQQRDLSRVYTKQGVQCADSDWETCKLAPERGAFCGDKYLLRWFFNDTAQRCERFWYGGCEGNNNNFADENECKEQCSSIDTRGTENIVIGEDDAKNNDNNRFVATSDNRCRAQSDRGPGTTYTVQWFHNSTSSRCERFWYGGVGGNDNRFAEEDQCTAACINVQVDEDICSQPSMTGRCRARLFRWYYNKDRQECQEFVYGGCDGNKNNFRSQAECERECLSNTSGFGTSTDCRQNRYGCCPDGVTASQGNNYEGCPAACKSSRYGCCDDEETAAQGPSGEGCETIEISSGDGVACDQTDYGCCPDGITVATGPSNAGCDDAARNTDDSDIDIDVPAQCRYPMDNGGCREDMKVMWYYDTQIGRCKQFWYGCQGNDNRFKSEKECLTTCKRAVVRATTTAPSLPVCEQAKEIGPCKAAIPRYFYNSRTGQCEVFQYGGCRGNQNNFETSAACEQQCRGRRLSAKEICAQSSDIGPCRSIQQKYAYNPQTKSCEQFTYGGCGGNRNNFDTETQCLQYCRETVPIVVVTPRPGRRQPVCEMSPALGPCTRSITKYHYNIATLQCEPFTYGGCLGNHNNFLSAEKCELYCGLRMGRSRTDDCRSPAEAGPCRGSIERWHYDARQGRCSLFNYGGCQGNTNNFGSEDECLSICRDERIVEPTRAPVTRPPPQQDEDICALPLVKTACEDDDHTHWYYDSGDGVCREVPDNDCNNNRNNFESRDQCEGYCSRSRVCRPLTYSSDVRCLAYMERFTYNENTDACEMFVYGGCGGTANNFDTVDTCNRKCKRQVTVVTDAPDTSSPSEVCAMAEDSGNCLAYLRKWRYDSLTGECVEFTYGGCGGNRNNFETQRDCQSYCRREVVCQRYEEPEIGCFAYMPRWKYDPESQSCENFVYGGCGGNANNFQTIDACEDKCLKDDEVERTTVRVDNRVSSWRDICRLQADVGPCKNYIRKWHYNSLSQECEEFTYGGCLGNHNNFESRVQCMTYCDDERRRGEVTTLEPDMTTEGSGEISTTEMATGVDACILEIEAGDCRGYFPKWAYDNLNGECKQFVYGGCGGNGNNYDSQEQCERQCGPREVCVLPQRAGNCLAYMPRFFFDYDSQDCKEFVFGGCDGNANNFETREACLRRCDSLIRDRPTVGPSVKSGYCPPRTDWGGLLGACAPTCSQDQDCASNLKCCHHGCGFKCVNAVSEEPYQMSTLNRASAYSMSSDSILVRWYDPSLGGDQLIRDNRYYTVRYFSYDLGQYNYVNVTELSTQVRGLRSDTEYNFNVRVNDPPYLSEWSEDVKNRTHSGVVTKPGTCPYLSDDTVGICVEECQHDGDCESSEKCCSNGCGNVCVTPQGYNLCSLPKDPGTCADWEVRWFYNTDISRCDRFWYGGCNEGNDNNFMGEDECENQCVNPIVRPVTTPRPTEGPYDCRRSMWGCCLDRYTPKYDAEGTNCREYNPQPGGETVVPATPGETATLTCRYGGDIAWYREGKLVVSDGRREVGSDGTLTIYAANIEDDGMYACRVTTADGRQPQYHRYMLQVQVPIGILPGPDMISVKPGRQAFLHCEVYGNPKPEVSWHKGSQSLGSDSLYEMFSNGTLLIRRAQEEDIDSYTCTANNGVSPAVDRTIKLELREMLSARIENENGRVMEGGRIKLTCEGRGYPQPTITWEKSGRPLSTEGNVFISSDGQLTIREVTPSETGQYTCIVANGVEKIETSTSVQVVPKVIPDDKCVDRTSIMKCRLIVSAKLCGYVMYSKICCNSCMRFYNDEP